MNQNLYYLEEICEEECWLMTNTITDSDSARNRNDVSGISLLCCQFANTWKLPLVDKLWSQYDY